MGLLPTYSIIISSHPASASMSSTKHRSTVSLPLAQSTPHSSHYLPTPLTHPVRAATREQHNQRLVLLLNRKTRLEAELSAHLTKLQRAYLAHSQDLQNALEARARTLEHPTT